MPTEILVGCCGFPSGVKRYVKEFKLTEVQKTFYKPPSPETLKSWRALAPSDFEFTVKAWQVITHPPTSPTYKKAGLKFDPKSEVGFFKPTRDVFEAWEKTRESCSILEAKVCVFQTPPSFKESQENINNMKEFFSSINSKGITLAWEPRGWNAETVRSLCVELGLIHVTDPFASMPSLEREISYFRLHGSPPGEKLYNYRYTKDDLNQLAEKLKLLRGRVYVLFNNIWMRDDASAFMEVLKERFGVN
ncbi:MAG: DUF72 domain-containing protein [Candidatus Jordarchaeales archaeon]